MPPDPNQPEAAEAGRVASLESDKRRSTATRRRDYGFSDADGRRSGTVKYNAALGFV